ncbi:cytochrome c oxidase assembly protein [Sphingomonas sp. T9W2]|uniref:cytochrome c oxidase assembly protein n=1 Tax=Sphingomonas sp. T9W2 TaxID=3143183 RepID=UPI0031F55C71
MIDWWRSYCGSAPVAGDWLARWNGDPLLITLLLAALVLAARLPVGRRGAGLSGITVLAITFVSPLCALSVALFSARAVHHLLLIGFAAPLLAMAWPVRGRVAVTLPLSTAILWAWHLPVLYDAALAHVGVYWLMQATLLASSWAYWASIRRASAMEAVAGIAGGAVQMGFLGALLTFAGRPLYESHIATTFAFGIGPLADQQMAGLIMWVPGMAPYAVAAAWIAARRWQDFATGRAAA